MTHTGQDALDGVITLAWYSEWLEKQEETVLSSPCQRVGTGLGSTQAVRCHHPKAAHPVQAAAQTKTEGTQDARYAGLEREAPT